MSALKNKIDFAALISVTMANPNGDPLNGNRPRTNYEGYGEISDVCIKRKFRNRMQDLGHPIFVQSDDRCDDGFTSLSERAKKSLEKTKNRDSYARAACEKWMDVRSFGQVFAFKGNQADGVSIGIRGPVSIHQAVSLSPVEALSMQITKSVNGEPSEKRSSDTMGSKHLIRYGLYLIKGSINVQLAQKTGFSEADAQVIKEALRTLFQNDASSARPEGSMEVYKVYWWEHNCPSGQYSSAKVHRSLHVKLKEAGTMPTCPEDYEITLDELPGLCCEVIDGI
ncbi:MAG TPA: type I-C CRISPR-associated protein Cas7/Csd2 [Candidatus Fimivicinus intestinavium]|nr:type I-C CRISPR-associated protein Cas7/Csd2 [Candidatus Fimivicinus intestinavium]